MEICTKYGHVKLTRPTSSDLPQGMAGCCGKGINSLEIDDDPYNTYGLASKMMVLSSLDEHDHSPTAHEDLFNKFIAQLYDIYDKQGELRINALSDQYSNVIYANRKVVLNGDTEHPKFIVCSNERDVDYDALVERVRVLEEKLSAMESDD